MICGNGAIDFEKYSTSSKHIAYIIFFYSRQTGVDYINTIRFHLRECI